MRLPGPSSSRRSLLDGGIASPLVVRPLVDELAREARRRYAALVAGAMQALIGSDVEEAAPGEHLGDPGVRHARHPGGNETAPELAARAASIREQSEPPPAELPTLRLEQRREGEVEGSRGRVPDPAGDRQAGRHEL